MQQRPLYARHARFHSDNVKKRRRASCADDSETQYEASDGYQDTISRQGNAIYFYSDVNPERVIELIQHLNKAESDMITKALPASHEGHIELHIHSVGGCVYSGINAMNHIQKMRVKVHTFVDGFVASAATFVLLGGHRRIMNKYSHILIHQLSTMVEGKYNDLMNEMENTKRTMNTVVSIYKDKTHLKKKLIRKLLSNELHFGHQHCLQYGIVDSVEG